MFYSFVMEKTKLTVFCEPSRSQWKITNRQPKASLGHCSSERNTPGWLTTTSPGPLPGSYAALKIRNGGKKMRFGQVGFPFRKNNWSAGILQQLISGATVVWIKMKKIKTFQVFISVISILRNCILRILFLSPHRMHMTVGERIVSQGQSNYSRVQIKASVQELLWSTNEMEKLQYVIDRHGQ